MTEYVYVATGGKTPEKVLIRLRCRLKIGKVCLVGSDDQEVRQCMGSIRIFSEKLGYVVEVFEADAFNVLPPSPEPAPPPFNSQEYASLLLESCQEFYCP